MKTKRNVLIVSDYFVPHWTGIVTSVHRLAKTITGFATVVVLTVQHEKSLALEEHVDGIRVLRTKPLLTLSRAKYSLSMIFTFIQIIKDYDVVLINSPSAHIAPLAILTKLFKKELLILHNGDLILPQGFTNRLIEVVFDVSSHIAFSLADRVSTYTLDYAQNSRVMKRYLHKFFRMLVLDQPGKSDVVSKELTALQTVRKKYKRIVGFAGRFVEEKGFDILLQAIPLVVQKRPDIHFVYAGEIHFSYENFYEKNVTHIRQARPFVTELGLLNQEEMYTFYSNLDLFVLPSRSDCYALVQVEAALNRVPIVVSDIPGARDIVTKTGFGLLTKKEDVEDLALQIEAALLHLDDFQKQYPKVKEYFDYEKSAHTVRAFISGRN